jgi:hypothetical protein
MRHGQTQREQLPVEPWFLFDPFAGLVQSSSSTAAHILDVQLFGCQHITLTDQAASLLMNEFPTQAPDTLMRLGNLAGQAPVPDWSLALRGTLTLQGGKAWQLWSYPPGVLNDLSIVERRPVIDTEVHAAVLTTRALARTGLIRHA